MAKYNPLTVIKLIKGAPCDDTYTDVIKFGSKAEQAAFFSGLAPWSFTNCSYQRVNNSVAYPRGALSCRVPGIADNYYDCNYVMFQNTSSNSKWFYAFIRKINYISPENTEIIYEIDSYQTYQFDYTVKPSMVLREHPENDVRFSNSQPEPFVVSQTRLNEVWTLFNYATKSNEDYIVWATSAPTGDGVGGGFVGDVFSAVGIFKNSDPAYLKDLITAYNLGKTVDNIIGVCSYPFDINYDSPVSTTEGTFVMFESIDGYVPKYQKVFSYPFCYFILTDKCGNKQMFKFEDFGKWAYSNNEAKFVFEQPKFNMRISCVYPPCVQITPKNYQSTSYEYWDKQIIFSDFPMTPVSTSSIWSLIQNSLSAVVRALPLLAM